MIWLILYLLGRHSRFPSLSSHCFRRLRRLFLVSKLGRLSSSHLVPIQTCCLSPPKQNVTTLKFLSPIIALGSSGTLTCKFLPNFHLLIFLNIQGVSQKLFGDNQINTSSTKSYTATQKYHFHYGKTNTSKL